MRVTQLTGCQPRGVCISAEIFAVYGVFALQVAAIRNKILLRELVAGAERQATASAGDECPGAWSDHGAAAHPM